MLAIRITSEKKDCPCPLAGKVAAKLRERVAGKRAYALIMDKQGEASPRAPHFDRVTVTARDLKELLEA